MRIEWNLMWVYVAIALPLALGLLAAWPLWANRVSDDIGSIAGSAVVFMFAVGFVAREYGEVEAITRQCIDANIGCHFHPVPFLRYGTFASIALVHVFVIFLTGLSIEERQRKRESSWR